VPCKRPTALDAWPSSTARDTGANGLPICAKAATCARSKTCWLDSRGPREAQAPLQPSADPAGSLSRASWGLAAEGVRDPCAQSIDFVTSHDEITLEDLASDSEKRNQANRDGGSHNLNWNYGSEGPTDDPMVLALRAVAGDHDAEKVALGEAG
jgi:hypothetical protein